VSESIPLPIFYGDLPLSLQAAMLFPIDHEKARVVVGWAIACNLQSPTDRSTDELVSIARDAAACIKIKQEVRRRDLAGQAVGEVVKALFAMVSNDKDRPVASIESSIQVLENVVVQAGQQVGRSRLHDYLGLLQPALHLWGAHNLDARRWPATQGDVDLFLERAEIIREQLVKWNADRSAKSQYLSGKFLQPYRGWVPTGLKLYPPCLRPDDVPVRRTAGRPKSRPAKSG
jgi:hypothetical protein